MEEGTFDCDMIHSILKRVWTLRALERENVEANDNPDSEAGIGTSRKNRPTSANANAVRLTSELLRVFITEAVQRAAAIAEAEGANQIEASHLEIILPQLLLDF
ncbi:protein MHF2 homolog isoform X1 [Abrus precatorius]|uniref:Protein MHF2 homolog isoform X1 n=1 Tax=Abrus precatorius TaxID=3816 RepID=A0A8B8JSK1_ABRPR|nr:protein MHF2 homolog isoform X1 [Abrus precatorius]